MGVGEIPGERIGKEGIKRFEETLSHSPRNESKISPKSKISPSQYLRPLVACPYSKEIVCCPKIKRGKGIRLLFSILRASSTRGKGAQGADRVMMF